MSTSLRLPFCTYFEIELDGITRKYFTRHVLSNRAAIYHYCIVNGLNIPDIHCITTFGTMELHEVEASDAVELA